jgi:hypothetical protein
MRCDKCNAYQEILNHIESEIAKTEKQAKRFCKDGLFNLANDFENKRQIFLELKGRVEKKETPKVKTFWERLWKGKVRK